MEPPGSSSDLAPALEAADKWQVMFPWCRLLRGRLQLQERELAPTRSVQRRPYWLLLTLPKHRRNAGAGQVQRLREALELLAVVAQADNAAFRRLLRDKCGVRVAPGQAVRATSDARLPLRVVLVFDDHAKESLLWPAALCNNFLALLSARTPSEDFQRDRLEVTRLAAGAGAEALESFGGVIPMRLHFWPRHMDLLGLTQYLQGVLRVLQSIRKLQPLGAGAIKPQRPVSAPENNQEQHDGGGKDPMAPFVLETLQLNLREFELNEAVAQALHEIVTLCGSLSCLQLPLRATDFLADDECPRQPLAECLLALTGGGSRSRLFSSTVLPPEEEECDVDTPDAATAAQTIMVNDGDMDDRRFAALCSALRDSSGVEELVLETAFAQDSLQARKIKWQWLAYALFTAYGQGETKSSVRKLVIQEPQLLAEDVAALASVVNANRPAEKLLDPLWAAHEAHERQAERSETPEDSLQEGEKTSKASTGDEASAKTIDMVRLQKDTVVYLEPLCSHDEWLRSSVLLERDANFVVMKDHSKSSDNNSENNPDSWVEILVPGFGKCWVHPDVALDRYTLESSPSSTGSLTSLALLVRQEESAKDQVLTEFFQLVGRGLTSVLLCTNWLREQGVDAVLRACPNLEKLELRGAQVEDVAVFTRAYDAGYCHIQSLSLEYFHVGPTSLETFANVLADPKRVVSSHLRELCIGKLRAEDVMASPANYERMLQAFARMLVSNSTLEFLELHIGGGFYPRFMAEFMAHEGERLIREEGPTLPLPCKLAFLSLGYSRSDAACGLHQLGKTLVRRIFAFAASYPIRHVCIVEY